MIRCRTVLFAITIALVSLGSAFPQELEGVEAERPTVGFIFNTSNLLLDIDAYQGGLGAKVRTSESVFRALAILGYGSTDSRVQAGLGVTFEEPLFTGRVGPYWGLLADLVFDSQRVELDEETSTQARVVMASVGAVLGVEVLIFDFLSIFGEYELSLNVSHTAATQSVAGRVTETSSTNFFFGAGMGNNGSLGIVVYLRPLGILGVTAAQE